MLNLLASAAVYTGNNYASDVVAAAGTGLDAIWFNANAAPPPVDAVRQLRRQPIATLQTLAELPNLILKAAQR